MNNVLLLIITIACLFACKENTKVTTTKFTDVGIKDSIIPALTAIADTVKIDSLKIQTVKNDTIVPGTS
ncbi:MAG: hypothetical protein LH615_08360, partial [Ferruginibacter sp.]|nr:hypothetical protein [Ferruginibacter sp.]